MPVPSIGQALRRTALACALALGLSLFQPTAVEAAAGECAQDIGTDLPVVLVHGFNSAMSTWDGGPGSIDRAVAGRPGLHVQWFDYSDVATQWVTHQRIGPRLATFLSCTAEVSRDSGGPGKVVVIAHSMGGLAIRCALAPSCGGSAGVDQVVDLVVTLGTPNDGSFLRPAPVNAAGVGLNAGTQALVSACAGPVARQEPMRRLCTSLALASGAVAVSGLDRSVGPLIDSPAARAFTPGSPELAALPDFPDRVGVLALGSEIRLVTRLFVDLVSKEWPVGDLIVGSGSATSRAQDGDAARGGRRVQDCGHVDWYLGVGVTPTCWHVSFTQDLTFSSDVMEALRRYQDSLGRAQPGSLALGLGGAIDGTGYWMAEDDAMGLVTAALGEPDSDSGWIPPECGPTEGVMWRLVRWGAFELLFTDSELPMPDGSVQPGGRVRHLAGWTYFEGFQREPGGLFPELALESGLTLGSSRSDVLEVYPEAQEGISPFPGGGLQVFRGDFGSLYVDFDAGDRVVALTSGQGGCGDV